jgi:hypothetical protein
MSNKQQPQPRNRALWEQEQQQSGELEILQTVHLNAIANDERVRDALKTPELQQLIRSIDGSRARLEALAAAQHNVPEFDAFCSHILSVIYGAEDARWKRNY